MRILKHEQHVRAEYLTNVAHRTREFMAASNPTEMMATARCESWYPNCSITEALYILDAILLTCEMHPNAIKLGLDGQNIEAKAYERWMEECRQGAHDY